MTAYADGERVVALPVHLRGGALGVARLRRRAGPAPERRIGAHGHPRAAVRRRASAPGARRQPELATFAALYPFGLDPFQVRACEALESGRGVLVAAPTGAGKTVVGEFAVHLALAEGRKCFYTTPIKALSNQKYADLVARYGADQVGLLTGDNSVNGEAPVVVMTTEVLRNMLYAGSQHAVRASATS